jgi:hypothetical protein
LCESLQKFPGQEHGTKKILDAFAFKILPFIMYKLLPAFIYFKTFLEATMLILLQCSL